MEHTTLELLFARFAGAPPDRVGPRGLHPPGTGLGSWATGSAM